MTRRDGRRDRDEKTKGEERWMKTRKGGWKPGSLVEELLTGRKNKGRGKMDEDEEEEGGSLEALLKNC
jgi:hypothetical protein